MKEPSFYTSRREFLTGSLSLLSAAATLPVFLGTTARALAQAADGASRNARRDHPILVVVQLAGGIDGLNTIIPVGMDPYYQYRRRLASPAPDVLKLEKGFGLHPSAVGLKELFDDGRMAVIHGVGYPNPNRSHFVSMDIWQAADPTLRTHNGWLGRYFDAQCKGHDADSDPLEGVALMQETPLALQGARFSPLSFSNPGALAWHTPVDGAAAEAVFEFLNNRDGSFTNAGPETVRYLQRAALKAQVGADEILTAAGERGATRRERRADRAGPQALARQLQTIKSMIAAGLPTRVYYVSFGGFDTHSGQADRHARLLGQFASAMKGFLDNLKTDGLSDRVLVLTFSEFGRRVQENASGGTDHGEAAPMFLFGSRVRPGLHGEHPDLRQLNRGDLAHTVDFRRVYAAVLRDWLKTNPEPILGPGFGPMRLIAT